jgi:tetratricopeptide (TPR) repeat protein
MLVLLAALATVYRSGASDYWFHLGAGRAIREHGLPAREMWCLAAAGQVAFLAGWPYQVALHVIHQLGGELGVAVWRAAWTALAAGLGVLLLRAVQAASWPAWLLGLLLVSASRDALRVRPEQALLPLLLFSLLQLERARRQRPDRTRWLVPAQVAWTNLHPAWVIGPVTAWIYSIAEWWTESGAPRGPETAPPPNRSRAWMILGLVLWAASALCPTPLVTLATPFRFLAPFHLSSLADSIDWLRRWSWSQDRLDPFTWLAALWLLGWVLGGRRAWRAAPALAIVSLLMMALGFYSAQFRDVAAWAAWAPMALALGSGGAGFWSRTRAVLALLAGLAGVYWLLPSPRFPLGIAPIASHMPVRAVALADSAGIPGVVLNEPENGGYILYARGQAHAPLIDSRLRGSDGLHESLMEARTAPLGLEFFLQTLPISHAIVPQPRLMEDRLATNLAERLEWALVWYDDGGCLFVRWRDQRLTDRAYRYLSPSTLAMTSMIASCRTDSGLAGRLERDLLRARASSPVHAHASEWLGELALARGRPQDGLRFLQEADAIDPDMPRLAMALGRAYERLGQPDQAHAAYTRALHQPDDAEEARRVLQTGSF